MTEKLTSYIPVWNKYLPAIRILTKKSAASEQVLGMNRSDFDKAAGLRKSGYRFLINFVDNKPDSLYSGNGFVQSFISVLQTDEQIRELLSKNNYSFVFTGKYQLQIKNNGLFEQASQPALEEEEILSH
jgi:hypothetical protein